MPKLHRPKKFQRRGVSALWLIITAPVFLIALCFAIEIGNIWLARVELENALEASALAAVKEFKDTGVPSQARDFAEAYAAANEVTGSPVVLDRNENPGDPNDNDQCDGDIVLGDISGAPGNYTFNADIPPATGYGVRTRSETQVNSVCQQLFGVPVGPFSVQAEVFALCETPGGMPELVRIANYVCAP